MTPIRVILDTDIGTDVDDCLALALILASPELELAAVTTVYGDVDLRARMVLKLLALHGGPDVPVAAGAAQPLLGQRPVHWERHEGQGLLDAGDTALQPAAEHAVTLIIRTVMAAPGAVTLVAIGPLTNVALAMLQEPRLAASLAGLVLMGGVVGGAYHQPAAETPGRFNALALPWAEHNFRSDPEAAAIVLQSGAPITIVPLDVTTQVRVRSADHGRIAATGDPYHLAVADQLARYPRYAARGWTYLHDPLAVAGLIRPELLQHERLHAVVETGGQFTAGKLLVALPTPAAPAMAQVALGVDAPGAEQFIVERLAR
jgi:purine nucleosidase